MGQTKSQIVSFWLIFGSTITVNLGFNVRAATYDVASTYDISATLAPLRWAKCYSKNVHIENTIFRLPFSTKTAPRLTPEDIHSGPQDIKTRQNVSRRNLPQKHVPKGSQSPSCAPTWSPRALRALRCDRKHRIWAPKWIFQGGSGSDL